MITFPNNGILLEAGDELPNLFDAKKLYLDVETTSGDPKLDSLNPWFHCKVAGIAITVDDEKRVWYVPRSALNVEWLKHVMGTAKTWINHNLKYDAHVLCNDLGIVFEGEWHDTLTSAKLVYSDFMSYSLDALTTLWLPKEYHKIGSILTAYLQGTKDYGDIPVVVLAEYACQDVVANRALERYILSRMPDESQKVFAVEKALTPVLFRVEQRGLHICAHTEIEQKVLELKWATSIVNLLDEINAELHDLNVWDFLEEFEPHNNKHCQQLFIDGFGLPALKFTEAGNPSFDKATLIDYGHLRGAPKDLIEKIREFRRLWIINNLFVEKYLMLNVDGRLHSSYNQSVRTGRMSCSQPNMQQLNDAAKHMIVPDPGCALISFDYSQIEFRTIVHYIQNPRAIEQYRADPKTDFHQWVADMCGIPRKPAKNVNFMLGYGGGKKKTLSMLAHSEELVAELEAMTTNKEAFERLCDQRANDVYTTYHRTLPELKRTATNAQNVCLSRAYRERIPENHDKEGNERRGYVTNAAGRRRYLPIKAAFRAFNTLNQSLAADIMKERTVALDEMLRCLWPNVTLRAIVHDDSVLCGPVDDLQHPRFVTDVLEVLENPSVKLRVPIKCGVSRVSTTSWADCSE